MSNEMAHGLMTISRKTMTMDGNSIRKNSPSNRTTEDLIIERSYEIVKLQDAHNIKGSIAQPHGYAMCGRKPVSLFQFGGMLILCLFAVTPVFADDTTPLGVWLDASKRIEVEVRPCGELLCGKLLWFKWPDDDQGLPVVDLKNKNLALRNRPLLDLTFLQNLRRTDEDVWEGGEIYNPDDGENYHVNMSIQDDQTLRVRVYDLLPIFGETHIWTRIARNCIGHHNDNKCPE